MSENSPSLFLLVIAAILAGVGGYFTRRVQKYEDTRDDAHLKVLPSLYFLIESFVKSYEIWKEKENFDDFRKKVSEIIPALGEKISSGEPLIAKMDIDGILTLHWGLQRLGVHLEEIAGNGERIKELLDSFENGNERYSAWLKVNPKTILEDARKVNKAIKTKIDSYRSISIMVIILVIIVAVIVGIAGFVQQIIDLPSISGNSTSG